MSRLVLGEPNVKQRAFFLARERYVAYGGARGGGKSWAVRKKAQLLALRYGGIKVLILRRTFPELRQNHILPLLADLAGIARYRDVDKAFYFANGSMIIFGYCDSERDVNRYQGNEYDCIFMDEATHFSEYMFDTLKVCVRGANGFPKRFYLTCNPGGVGHEWVKRLFIVRDFREHENPSDYVFIRALVYDNPALMVNDPGYVDQLRNLPEVLRKAWLDGSWDVFAGQYFPEWREDVHVCVPFAIPETWVVYRALDYGLDMLACYWIAVDEAGGAVVFRELYEGRDNGLGENGDGHIISRACERILEESREEVYLTLAPPDLWNRRQETGRSAADIFLEHGVGLTKTSNSRVDGWLAVKEFLRVDRDEFGGMVAGLGVFNCCVNLIRCLPALQRDPKREADVCLVPHELTHGPDALRGFCIYWTTVGIHGGVSKRRARWSRDLFEDYYACGEDERARMVERLGDPF